MRDETGEVMAEPTKIEPTRPTDWHPVEEKQPEPQAPTPQPEPMPVALAQEMPMPAPVKEAVPKPVEVKPVTPAHTLSRAFDTKRYCNVDDAD